MNTSNQAAPQTARIEVENTPDGFKLGARFVRTQLEAWPVNERTRYIADLAVDEILNNIIHHAYTDNQTHTITITLALEAGTLTLGFIDDGTPFDPVAATPLEQTASIDHARIGGRGLLMIRKMASNLRYERSNQHNLLEVTVTQDP